MNKCRYCGKEVAEGLGACVACWEAAWPPGYTGQSPARHHPGQGAKAIHCERCERLFALLQKCSTRCERLLDELENRVKSERNGIS